MSNSKDIQGHLSQVARGQEPSEKLEFDPQTGKLRVTRTPNPDNVVATKMAASGFFGFTYITTTSLVADIEEIFWYSVWCGDLDILRMDLVISWYCVVFLVFGSFVLFVWLRNASFDVYITMYQLCSKLCGIIWLFICMSSSSGNGNDLYIVLYNALLLVSVSPWFHLSNLFTAALALRSCYDYVVRLFIHRTATLNKYIL